MRRFNFNQVLGLNTAPARLMRIRKSVAFGASTVSSRNIGPDSYCPARHPNANLNFCVLSSMASYDVASTSNICLGPCIDAHSEPLFLELDAML